MTTTTTTRIVCDVCDRDISTASAYYEVAPTGDTTYEDPPAMDVCRDCVVTGLEAARRAKASEKAPCPCLACQDVARRTRTKGDTQ